VFDGEGRAMTPSHATKPGKRYRYYVTRSDQLDDAPAWRVSAHDLERLVCEQLSRHLGDQQMLCDLAPAAPADIVQALLARADLAAAALRSGPAGERAKLLAAVITRIDLHEEGIDLTVDQAILAKALGLELLDGLSNTSFIMTLPATRVRRGHQLRLVIPGPQTLNIVPARRDEKLVALIAEALEARKLILAEPEKSIASIAAANGRCRTRLSKLVGLSCMAPDIVTAIVEGRQSATLTARMLQDIDLPLAWANQRTLLGVN
jgi:site-specific DNA recombinase